MKHYAALQKKAVWSALCFEPCTALSAWLAHMHKSEIFT